MELDQQHNMEKGHALEAVEVKKKAELLQLKFEFLSHYQLGLQVRTSLLTSWNGGVCMVKGALSVSKPHLGYCA